ncbi:hypothetical protein TNCV_4183851 [Trichonephila clavipes]|nr:hypothetical protein TNCV_4183851 [Trichonephila clavipes]
MARLRLPSARLVFDLPQHDALARNDAMRPCISLALPPPTLGYRWIPRGVSFQRPRHRLIAVASLGHLPRNRSIPVWFTRYPRTALSDRWRSLGIMSLMNIGGIRYVHIHSYIGHHDQACVLACKIQCISKFHEIKLKS